MLMNIFLAIVSELLMDLLIAVPHFNLQQGYRENFCKLLPIIATTKGSIVCI